MEVNPAIWLFIFDKSDIRSGDGADNRLNPHPQNLPLPKWRRSNHGEHRHFDFNCRSDKNLQLPLHKANRHNFGVLKPQNSLRLRILPCFKVLHHYLYRHLLCYHRVRLFRNLHRG